MPRIRTVKPSYWQSEHVAPRLPGPDGRQARLLFLALLNFAEDTGVARAHPAVIRAEVFPFDADLSLEDVGRWLVALASARLIQMFEHDGTQYLWIRGFKEHQVINRPSRSFLPHPPAEEIHPSPVEVERENHGALHEDSRSPHGGSSEGNGSGKGKGSNKQETWLSENETTDALRLSPTLARPAGRAKRSKAPKAPKAKGDPRHEPVRLELVAEFEKRRAGKYGFQPRDAKAITSLLALAEDGEILRRWQMGLSGSGFQRLNSIHELVTKWNCYTGVDPSRAVDLRKGIVYSQDVDWETEPPPDDPTDPNCLYEHAHWESAQRQLADIKVAREMKAAQN